MCDGPWQIRKAQRRWGGGEMSLINEVLRNLEVSRPDDPARQNLQREIRALPVVKKGRGKVLFWVGFGSLSVAAAGALMVFDGQRLALPDLPWLSNVVPAAAPVAVAPPPAPAPTVQASDNAASPVPVVLTEAMLPQPSMQLDLATSENKGPVISSPAAAAPEPSLHAAVTLLPSTSVVVPGIPAKKLAEPVVAPAPAPAAPAPAVVLAPPAPPVVATRIEKTAIPPSPRELAEQEYRRAESLIAAGQLELAATGLAQALKIDPGHLPARQKLIRLQLGQRQNDEAMASLEAGLVLTPNQTGWAISLARLELDKGDIGAAIHTLERSRPYAENRADYAGFLGHLKSRAGAQAEAAKYYMHAARLSPNEGRWWLGLGLALAAENRQTEAAEAFRQAVATGSLSGDLLRMAQQQGK
jgi:MSHA biogenesis protein MshN